MSRLRGAEVDALVSEYSHENRRPRERDALQSLKKIASLVKPIMRARGWKVGTLAEFYPAQANLLGLNINGGQKICLRLRHPGDANQFLPLEQVVDTMLHELVHNVIGPHNAEFHAMWDQLRDEYEGLIRKGYTGEGFMSDGKVLGGRRVPRDEARRLARAAAEKRRTLTAGSGQKLGGAPVRPGQDIRRVIVEAVERRNTVLQGCGSTQKNPIEIRDISDEVSRNGFTTKAEEDDANERAIAQALWELVQEDEQRKYGEAYIPPSAVNPTGNGGGSSMSGPAKSSISTISPTPPPIPLASKPARQLQISRDKSRIVHPPNTLRFPETRPNFPISISTVGPTAQVDKQARHSSSDFWECPTCTCHNPVNLLCCDACTSERPEAVSRDILNPAKRQQQSRGIDHNGIAMPSTWTCPRCTTEMANEWWICSSCDFMKTSS